MNELAAHYRENKAKIDRLRRVLELVRTSEVKESHAM